MSTPRKRLDREQVLTTAEGIVDRDGWTNLTMTALAAELGVKVPSLYNHVPNLEALLGQLQNRAFHDLGERLNRAAIGRSGPTALRAMAATFRTFALDHPSRYDLAVRAPVDPEGFELATLAAGRALWAVIHSYGLAEPTVELQLSVFAVLHGVVALEVAGFLPATVDADAMYAQAVDVALALLDAAAPHPVG